MAVGWIKLHRRIQDCSLWENDEPFDRRSAWIDLLLLANHEDKQIIFKGKPLTVKRGQRITSIRKLGERWSWSANRVKRYLDLLVALEMITKESDSNRTLLTIVKYGDFQDARYSDEHTDEHTHEYTDEYTDEYTGEYSDGLQTRMIKNDKRMIKNEKKERKEEHASKKNKYGEYNHVLLTDDEYNRLCEDYGKSIAETAIKKVDEYCEQTGKHYKNYNLTIRKWGVESAKKSQPVGLHESGLDMYAELERKLNSDGAC